MLALRASQVFDGAEFLDGGGTVLVDDGHIVGVETRGFEVPVDCETRTFDGTVLPGLIDMHTHLVTDSGPMALDRVAGYSHDEIEAVVAEALRRQLAVGVTTVRDLGDRAFHVVARRDGPPSGALEPRIVASGPPITSSGGHCHFLGGEVVGREGIRSAVRDRVARRVDVVKVMASGGLNTPGTDVLLTQFTDDELRVLVDESHTAGLPVTAHAHGTPAVRQAVAAGVDGIEHCTCATAEGVGRCDDELIGAMARGGVTVCPTFGFDPALRGQSPAPVRAMAARFGTTIERMTADRWAFVARLREAGVRVVSGVDSGIQPPKAHGVLPHAVLELLEAGFDIAGALATATSTAADACGLAATTGRVRAGLEADLLVVDGDLSTDATALHRVALVLRGGQPLT
jgi:imidazolonepropionase-like amidohydrolase